MDDKQNFGDFVQRKTGFVKVINNTNNTIRNKNIQFFSSIDLCAWVFFFANGLNLPDQHPAVVDLISVEPYCQNGLIYLTDCPQRLVIYLKKKIPNER